MGPFDKVLRISRQLWIVVVMGIVLHTTSAASEAEPAWVAQLTATLGNGALLVEDQSGRTVLDLHADETFVPASILKLATSACALLTLPNNYRFQTSFHYGTNGVLYVKGFGDPALTSEELAQAARGLRGRGVHDVRGIVLDDSFFAPHLAIDGQSASANPYDAQNSALLANFNTIFIRKAKNGQVVSAEPQTPITAMTLDLAKGLRAGTHRINVSRDSGKALLYVGHLLKAFFEHEGVAVAGEITAGRVPNGLAATYVHTSSQSLPHLIRALLENSNNLMTNQLFLTMGAQKFGPPATVEKGQAVMHECLKTQFGWRNFVVMEGSGLSKQNQVTAHQMMRLVRFFERYRDLVPMKEPPFQAKTGTLNGVSTLAGFFDTPSRHHYRFVLMLNAPGVGYWSKFKVAKLLYDGLSGTMLSKK
ncbi:MAG: D-alanyl-D-alanine carboxypeptidase [Deltaproteobacteria bacterium]|nr:D-alanyl-D-alanine carboxypeptidase [Deltaproteobacteria bacterium]